MQTIEGGERLDNGFVFRDGENHPIVRARIDHAWGEQEHAMQHASIELVEAGGRTHRLHAEAIGCFPILREDVWLEETHVTYELEAAEGERARPGQGVVEHVWRAKPDEIRARAERFSPLAKAFRK